MLIGTEIFQFRPLGGEKMGLEVSNLISKNMTKSISLWLSFPWVFNDLSVLRVQILLTNERTISSWIDQ